MIRRRKGSVEVHVHEFLTTILRWIKRSVSSFAAFTSWKNPALIKYVAALDVMVKRKILSLPKKKKPSRAAHSCPDTQEISPYFIDVHCYVHRARHWLLSCAR
jgi:hypothetical protein